MVSSRLQNLSFPSWRFDGWTLFVLAIAFLVATPIFFILGSVFVDVGDIWQHLAQTVLGEYIAHSFILMFGVGAGVFAIGVGTAWLVTMCQFPGRRVFSIALLLPFAAPGYILAYAYATLLDFFGPVQSGLRTLTGWQSVDDYWFPNIRSLWGAILMLILVLYPYVYLLTRVAFQEQATRTLEASRCLGCNPWRSFWAVALPLARPAIASGLALALMETLGDFGTVQFYGVTTFTTGIYSTWFGMGERIAAAQLAAVLMLFILVLVVLERRSRAQARFYQTSAPQQSPPRYDLNGMRQGLAMLACLLPVVLGFVVPGGYLLYLAVAKGGESSFDERFWELSSNSILLASITAAVGLVVALIMAYGQRLSGNLLLRLGVRISAMGYAIPGTVIAVGILIPVTRLDNTIDAFMRSTFGLSTGLLLSGTIVALIFAYLVRFLAVGFNTVESSLSKIEPNLDEASRSLGHNTTATLWRVHVPLLQGGTISAAMLIFVDVMKELPATLVIRPFNFDTLAVQAYQYASDERLIQASAPALAIVLVGMIPVIILSWRLMKSS